MRKILAITIVAMFLSTISTATFATGELTVRTVMTTDMPDTSGDDNSGPFIEPSPTPDPGPDSTDSGDSWDSGSSGGGFDGGDYGGTVLF